MPQFEKLMLFQMREKFVDIGSSSFARNTELVAQFVGYLCFRAALFQEFQNARAHKVRTEHLSVEDVEDDGAVLIVV